MSTTTRSVTTQSSIEFVTKGFVFPAAAAERRGDCTSLTVTERRPYIPVLAFSKVFEVIKRISEIPRICVVDRLTVPAVNIICFSSAMCTVH